MAIQTGKVFDPSQFKLVLSQLGFDVNSVGDANVYFSSDFRVPLIVLEGTCAGNGTVNHNLNYVPFFMAWDNGASGFGAGFDPGYNTTVTKTQLKFGNSASDTMKYRIFAIDITKPYQAKSLNTAVGNITGLKTQQLTMRVAKKGKSVYSTDLRDFTLNADTRSFILHQVLTGATGTVSGGDYNGIHGFKYIPDLPYHPMYFPFWSADGLTWKPLNGIAQSPPKVNIDSTDKNPVINALGKTGDYYSMVTLKDPLSSGKFDTVSSTI